MGRSKEKGVDDKGASDTEIDAKILFDEYILKNAQNGCVSLSTFQTFTASEAKKPIQQPSGSGDARVYSAGEGKADRCRAPIDSKKSVPLKNSANTDSLKNNYGGDDRDRTDYLLNAIQEKNA